MAKKGPGLFSDLALAERTLNYKSERFGDVNVVAWFESHWNRYAPFADRDFAHRLNDAFIRLAAGEPGELRRTSALHCFQRLFWEMYLGVGLLDRHLPLVPRVNRDESGPDFLVDAASGAFWIEAIAPDGGIGPDRVVDMTGVGGCHDVPNDQISLRLLHALREKSKQIDRWMASGVVGNNDPVVVAINDTNIPHAHTDFTPPRIVRVLFGCGMPAIDIDRQTGKFGREYLTQQDSISKQSGTGVDTGAFARGELRRVSSVIFSSINPWSKLNGDGPDFLHIANPNALAPIAPGWLHKCIDYSMESGAETDRIRWTER